MENMEKTQVPRIERVKKVWTPDARLYIPHEGKMITFAYSSLGPNTYTEVGKQILNNGMKVPNGDYTASLLHAAYFSQRADEPGFQNVGKIVENGWLGVFNRNLWTSDGIYVVPDLKALGRSQPLDQNTLEKMLKGSKEINGVRASRDGRVRFAEKGSYVLGEHTSESLAKDGFVVASYGVEGAEKVAEVSGKFKCNPKTYGVDVEKGQSPELRVSALNVVRDFVGRLVVYGDNFDDDRNCHAFGVLEVE